jgi:hypothetical protein
MFSSVIRTPKVGHRERDSDACAFGKLSPRWLDLIGRRQLAI